MTGENNLLMLIVAGELIRESGRGPDRRAGRRRRQGIFHRRARLPAVVPDR